MASRKPTRQRRTSPPDDPVTAYAEDVVAGRIVAGPHVRNACRRHLLDLKEAPKRGFIWNEISPAEIAAAKAQRRDPKRPVDRIIGFFKTVLCLNGGQFEGEPFHLHPSQAFIVGSLFGWHRSDWTRRFRRCYIEAAKGIGKSPLLAGIGLYCMLADGEARAEVYAAGSKKDQAMVLFRDAVAMVDQSPALRARFTKSGGNPVWNLADLKTGSFFRPISSDEGQSGPRPSCALCDEVHEHRDGRMVELLERGFKWRRQPLLVMATNSGSDRNSVCWQEHQHAVRVACGSRDPGTDFTFVGEVIDDETFAFVCALDEGDDPLEDPSCWVKANPLLGITVKEDYLAGVVRQAKAIPGKLNGILRLHFCQWTDAEQAWMSRSALENVLAEFDPAEHAGAKVFIGADLSGSQDLTALAFVAETGRIDVPRDDGGTVSLPTYDAWIEAWTPRDTLHERALRDQAPYDVWVEQGWLHAESGKNIRLDFVAARIAEVAADCVVELLAYDRYVYAKLADELDALGVTVTQVEHPQGGKRRAKESGLWMPGSLTTLENLILERRIRLRRNPVLVSALMGATTEHDPFDNRWFSKRKATTRIDPAVALAMAIGAATAGVETESVYEKRPLLVF